MKKVDTKFLAQSGLIAALYTAITIIFAPISFGVVQFRISEALTVLPFFTLSAVPGVTVGCLISNIILGAHWMDIIFGTLATLIGAILSYKLRRWPYLVCLPPIISNAVIVPWVLRFAYGSKDLIPFMVASVGLGEIISVGIIGNILLFFLKSSVGKRIFK